MGRHALLGALGGRELERAPARTPGIRPPFEEDGGVLLTVAMRLSTWAATRSIPVSPSTKRTTVAGSMLAVHTNPSKGSVQAKRRGQR